MNDPILPAIAGRRVVFDRGRKTVDADGIIHTQRGTTYTWLGCDVCGEVILTAGLEPDQDRIQTDPDYRKGRGRPCRLTPHCSGRHVMGAPGAEPEATLGLGVAS